MYDYCAVYESSAFKKKSDFYDTDGARKSCLIRSIIKLLCISGQPYILMSLNCRSEEGLVLVLEDGVVLVMGRVEEFDHGNYSQGIQ